MRVYNEQACAQFRCRRKMLGGRFTGKDQEVVGSSATFESITPASRTVATAISQLDRRRRGNSDKAPISWEAALSSMGRSLFFDFFWPPQGSSRREPARRAWWSLPVEVKDSPVSSHSIGLHQLKLGSGSRPAITLTCICSSRIPSS